MINAIEARELAVKKSFEVLKDVAIDIVLTIIHSCAKSGGLSCEFYEKLTNEQIFKLNLLGFTVQDKSEIIYQKSYYFGRRDIDPHETFKYIISW